jgi:hypothetical protein
VILKYLMVCVVMFMFQIDLILLSRDFSLYLRYKCKLYIITTNAIDILKGHDPGFMNKNTRKFRTLPRNTIAYQAPRTLNNNQLFF